MQIAAMIFTAVFSVILPLGLMLWVRRKGGRWSAFFVGAGIFILFAMILEQILHSLVLYSPLGGIVQNNIWLYALYGGLAAGLFEETGRYVAFRFFLKKRREAVTPLAYGAGHGGIEAVLIVGLTMVNNMVLLASANSGSLTDPALIEAAEALSAIPAGMFLWAAFERASAILLHVALSVLVFAAVHKPEKRWLFPAAILLHAGLDALSVLLSSRMPVAVTEFAALLYAVLVALWAARVYRNLKTA